MAGNGSSLKVSSFAAGYVAQGEAGQSPGLNVVMAYIVGDPVRWNHNRGSFPFTDLRADREGICRCSCQTFAL